MQRAN